MNSRSSACTQAGRLSFQKSHAIAGLISDWFEISMWELPAMSKQGSDLGHYASGARRPGWSKSGRMGARRAETRRSGTRFTTAVPEGGRPTIRNAKVTEQLVDQVNEVLRPVRKDHTSCAMLFRRQRKLARGQKLSIETVSSRRYQAQTRSLAALVHQESPVGLGDTLPGCADVAAHQ